MKILEKAIMPDGTPIQLEDWSGNNTAEYPELYGLMIGAYPLQQRSSRYITAHPGKRFRLSIDQDSRRGYSNDAVRDDFNALKDGSKKLEDLSPHFWNGKKDMWYLGMDVHISETGLKWY